MLRPEVQLGGPSMTLADLAEVDAPDEEVRRRFGALSLGRAPLAGYLERRTRAELEMSLRGQALTSGQTLVWHGAASVKIRSLSQRLDAASLLELAREQLRRTFAEEGLRIDASLASPLPDLTAPAGALRFRARLADTTRLRPRMAVWIDVIAADTVYRSVVVPLAVTANRGVYRARRDLPAGSLATVDDFVVAEQDIAGLADAALVPGVSGGGRVRQAVAAGQTLTARQIAPVDMVLRGERLRLITSAAGIAVETAAYAQADAAVGQRVQVRPERSNETIVARVIAAGTVGMDAQ